MSHDGVTLDVDCDVSTAILLVFIRRWRIAVLQSKRRDQHPELYPGWCYRKVIFIKMALRTKYFGRTKNRIQFKIGNDYRHLKNDLEKPKRSPTDKKKTTKPYNWSKLTNEGTSAILEQKSLCCKTDHLVLQTGAQMFVGWLALTQGKILTLFSPFLCSKPSWDSFLFSF